MTPGKIITVINCLLNQIVIIELCIGDCSVTVVEVESLVAMLELGPHFLDGALALFGGEKSILENGICSQLSIDKTNCLIKR